MKHLFNLLKRTDFAALFWAQVSGVMNDNLIRTALTALIAANIFTVSNGQTSTLILLIITIYMLPFFLFSILAGQIGDKYDKAQITRIIKFTEIFTVLIAALGFYFHSLPILFITLFIMGAQSAFFGPIKYALMTQIVQKNDFIDGNALLESSRYISILLGTILGTMFATPKLGFLTVVLIMLILAVAGYMITRLIPPLPQLAKDLKISPNIFKSTWRNLSKAQKSKKLFLAILAINWFWVLGAILLSQLNTVTNSILNLAPQVYTFLTAVFCISVAIGCLASYRLVKTEISIKYVPLSTVGMSLALLFIALILALIPEFTAPITLPYFLSSIFGICLTIGIIILSICGGLYIVPLNAHLQSMISDKFKTRTLATCNFLNAVFMVIAGAIAYGLLYIGLGTPAIITVLAIANFVIAVYTCTLLPDYVLRSAVYFLLNSVYKIKLIGMENYSKAEGPTVIVANNNSFLDPLLLAAFLPEDIVFMVDSNIAKRFWVRIFLKYVRHIPVDPTNAIAVKTIIDRVKKGTKVVIFPEGRMSTTSGIMKVYPGPAMIVERSGAQVLPIFIQNTQYTRWSYYGRKLRHLPSNLEYIINVLPPRKIALEEGLKGRNRRYKAEDKVYDLMLEMKVKSFNLNHTIFRCLIEAVDLARRSTRALEDMTRKTVSFGTLLTGSFLLGRKFTHFSKEGEYIGLMLPNVNACALSIFGLMAYGRVPAMINFSAGVKNILLALKVSQVKVVITSRAFVEKAELGNIIDAINKTDTKIVYLEDIQKTITLKDKLFALSQSAFPHQAYKMTCKDRNPDKPAIILFTSGSEGAPKGVVLSHKNLNMNRYQMSSLIQMGLQDKFFNALPMFHSFGLACGLFIPILNGSSVFLYPSPLHYKAIPELVYDRNANIFFGTDTFLNAYGKQAHPYDFYNIKYIGIGGEKLKDETFALWTEKFGIRILEAYGTTEASPVVSFNTPMYYRRGTVGKLLPCMEARLEPVEGVKEGGRLFIKGDNVMLGYLKEDNPGVIQTLKDGWYDTGDIVDFDADGFVVMKGRAKRFAKIAGEMVSLTAVEFAMTEIWPDIRHAVISKPDAKRGEQLIAYTQKQDADIKVLQQALKDKGFSELWIPKTLRVVEEIPLGGTGKTDYIRLKSEEIKNFGEN